MAITKIHPIRRTLNKAIKYITNPLKTEEEMFVSTFGCTRESIAEEFDFTKRQASYTGSTLAQHIIQSFAQGEVSAKEAHMIGKELVQRLTGNRNEYIIATHLDKGHIHNHIIFNQVDFVEHKHFRSNMKTVKQLRQLSDEICEEHGLSVIKEPMAKGLSYYEWQMSRDGKSYKKKLKDNIDRVIPNSESYEDFLKNMVAIGYEIKQGKYDSFRFHEQERFTRSKTLGINYTKEAITNRITAVKEKPTGMVITKPVEIRIWKFDHSIGLIDNYHNLMLTAEGKYYRQHLAIQDAKKIAATYNYLKEHHISSLADVELMVNENKDEIKEVHNAIRNIEDKIANQNEILKYASRIQTNQPVWEAYIQSAKSTVFREEHRSELVLFESAQTALKRLNISDDSLQLNTLSNELQSLTLKKTELSTRMTTLKEEKKSLAIVQQNVESLLADEVKENSQERKKERE
jgi:hypothetical protein